MSSEGLSAEDESILSRFEHGEHVTMPDDLTPDEIRELAKNDPSSASKAMHDRIIKIVPPPAPFSQSNEEIEQTRQIENDAALLRRQVEDEKLRILARRIATREVDEYEHNAAASSAEIVERAQDGESAIFDVPELPEAVWGNGSRIAWAKGQGTMIAAPQGLGKSTLAQQLMLRRIGLLEDDFLGMPVMPSDAKVLYLAMDRPLQARQSMRRMVEDSPEARSLVKEKLVVWSGPFPFHLVDNPRYLAEWVQEKAPGCQTVIFDSVKDMTTGVSDETNGAAINTAWQELIANEVDVLALHHHRKGGQGSEKIHSIDEIYGSTWLTSGLGSIFTLDGKAGEARVTLKHLKSAVEMLEDIEVIHDFKTGRSVASDAPAYTVAGVLGSHGASPDGITVSQIAMLVFSQDTKKTRGDVRKKLVSLRDSLGIAQKLPPVPGQGANQPERWRHVEASASTGGSIDWAAAINSL